MARRSTPQIALTPAVSVAIAHHAGFPALKEQLTAGAGGFGRHKRTSLDAGGCAIEERRKSAPRAAITRRSSRIRLRKAGFKCQRSTINKSTLINTA